MCRDEDVSANRAHMQRKVRISTIALFVISNYLVILMFSLMAQLINVYVALMLQESMVENFFNI